MAACTCAPITTAGQVANADVIVIGTAVGVIRDDDPEFGPSRDIVLSVERYLKGSGNKEVVVDDGLPCDWFGQDAVGQRYLLLMSRTSSGALVPGWCNGNAVLSSGDSTVSQRITEIEQELGLSPGKGESPAAPDGSDRVLNGLAVVALLALLGGLAWILIHRRQA